MSAMSRRAFQQYGQVGHNVVIDEASPHRLVQMLFEGALDRIARARGHMARGEVGPKGEQIGRALAIVDVLRASLDMEQGGDLARGLADLYDYIEMQLMRANAQSDDALLGSVADLLRELKSGWDGIGGEVG